RPGDDQPGQGARGLHEAQVGQPPLRRPRAQRPEDNQGIQHPMMTKTRSLWVVLALVMVLAWAAEARAAVVIGADGKPVRIEPGGKFLRIIETLKAKSTSIPVYGQDSDVPMSEAYVTRLVRVENADPNEVAQVLGRLKGEQGDVIVYAPQGALIITDLASN